MNLEETTSNQDLRDMKCLMHTATTKLMHILNSVMGEVAKELLKDLLANPMPVEALLIKDTNSNNIMEKKLIVVSSKTLFLTNWWALD